MPAGVGRGSAAAAGDPERAGEVAAAADGAAVRSPEGYREIRGLAPAGSPATSETVSSDAPSAV